MSDDYVLRFILKNRLNIFFIFLIKWENIIHVHEKLKFVFMLGKHIPLTHTGLIQLNHYKSQDLI